MGTGKPVVVCIEDHPINRRLIEVLAERHGGVAIEFAGNARDGFELVQGRTPALVVLDLTLPDADGEDVLRWVRADPALDPVEVVVLSARADPELRKRLLDGGAKQYLTKPFDVHDLLQLFNEAVASAGEGS